MIFFIKKIILPNFLPHHLKSHQISVRSSHTNLNESKKHWGEGGPGGGELPGGTQIWLIIALQNNIIIKY